jgi:hypothetical protein
MRLWEGAEVIPDRSAARAARTRQTAIGFAKAIGGREMSIQAPLNSLPELGFSLLLGPNVLGLALPGSRRIRS